MTTTERILSARKALETLTPLRGDCGRKCGAACCHPDEDGEFTKETYESLVHLTAWLCGKFNLTAEDIIRHYDVTGKKCPLYYVEYEDAWKQFLKDVQNYIEQNGKEAEEDFS